jgi:hypothetical protein
LPQLLLQNHGSLTRRQRLLLAQGIFLFFFLSLKKSFARETAWSLGSRAAKDKFLRQRNRPRHQRRCNMLTVEFTRNWMRRKIFQSFDRLIGLIDDEENKQFPPERRGARQLYDPIGQKSLPNEKR